MAVPEFQCFMLPILQLFKDNKTHTTNECMNTTIEYFKLDENDIKLTVPSGKQTLVANRVYWSLTYLKKSLLLEPTKRGEYKITTRGIQLLEKSLKELTKNYYLNMKNIVSLVIKKMVFIMLTLIRQKKLLLKKI